MQNLPSTPSFQLDNQRAIVTGAGRGIGAAAAVALAQAGAEVTLVARSANEIESVAKAINDQGYKAQAQTLDVSSLSDVTAFFADRRAFNIVVNNAGTNRPAPLAEVTEEDYDAVLDLNLKSTYFVTQSATQKMIDEGVRGSLIHISSQMGHVGGPNRTLYCASKWGLEGFNKAVALDLAQYGIRSNTICPTFIKTPMTKPFFEDKKFLESPVVFLASEASSLMTGSSMVVDGGWTAE